MTVTVAFDIDGVVSPITPAGAPPDGGDDWTRLDIWGGMWVREATRALLHDLDADPGVRPCWHTTWQAAAGNLLAPALGVGAAWPHLAGTTDADLSEEGKLRAVETWIDTHEGTGAHLVWCEDAANPRNPRSFVRSASFAPSRYRVVRLALIRDHPQATVIAPLTRTGLTPADIALVRRQVAAHTPTDPDRKDAS